jgi:hypothetical protein
VIDVLLIAEITWCTLLLKHKGVHATLLYAGGILTSGYVAFQLSAWLSDKFLPPVSPAFHWIESHISSDAQSVSTLSAFLPSIPASGGFQHSQWIAMHLVRTFFFLTITVAVFALFVVIDYLSDALWDRPLFVQRIHHTVLLTSLALGCGIYVAWLTVILFTNLAWLQNFSVITSELTHSIGIRAVGRAASTLQGWFLP